HFRHAPCSVNGTTPRVWSVSSRARPQTRTEDEPEMFLQTKRCRGGSAVVMAERALDSREIGRAVCASGIRRQRSWVMRRQLVWMLFLSIIAAGAAVMAAGRPVSDESRQSAAAPVAVQRVAVPATGMRDEAAMVL